MTAGDDLICPRCNLPLKQVQMIGRNFWACGNCGGRAVTLELLRHTFTPESINPLWLHAIRAEGKTSVPCPSCKNAMFEVALSDKAQVRVDVCRVCHFVWFDAHEVDSLRPKPLDEISREERERTASDKVKRFAAELDQYQVTTTPVTEAWRALADFFRGI